MRLLLRSHRQRIINSFCGGVIGFCSYELWKIGKPLMCLTMFLAFIAAIINSLIPEETE